MACCIILGVFIGFVIKIIAVFRASLLRVPNLQDPLTWQLEGVNHDR